MKVSRAKAALLGLALVAALIGLFVLVRPPAAPSGAMSTGPTTPAVEGATSAAPTGSSSTPPSARASASTPPSTTASSPPRRLVATAVPGRVVRVRPRLESVGFSGSGDISDDAAIWIDPAHPARSVVVADNKSDTDGGVGVFDMSGKLLQFDAAGSIGNVDLRTGFPGRGGSVVLVGANNRSTNTLALWALDPESRRISSVNGAQIKTMASNYGFCLYHSKISGRFYAFITPEEEGVVQQFELLPRTSGLVDAKLVRQLPIGGKTEGCVADDDRGRLYAGEEGFGIWAYGAEPSDSRARVAVDKVGRGHLVADVEGMTIAYGPSGSGYLIVSSQGDSTIAVYAREGDNRFIKRLKIVGRAGVDAVTGTDGLDVTAQNAGPGFTDGLLVVHDESNTGGRTSNLKYVSLSAVLRAS